MLRFNLSGFWSRRITQEHRLIYEVTEQYIRVVIIIVKKAIAPSQKAIALLVTKLNLKGDRLHP